MPFLPLFDVLQRPSVQLLVSSCGFHSAMEAIAAAVPLLCIPFTADQTETAGYLTAAGVAETLRWQDITSDIVADAIARLTAPNSTYVCLMASLSRACNHI